MISLKWLSLVGSACLSRPGPGHHVRLRRRLNRSGRSRRGGEESATGRSFHMPWFTGRILTRATTSRASGRPASSVAVALYLIDCDKHYLCERALASPRFWLRFYLTCVVTRYSEICCKCACGCGVRVACLLIPCGESSVGVFRSMMFEMSVFSAVPSIIVNCLLVIVPIAVFFRQKDHFRVLLKANMVQSTM
jgi:hypothetical protein